MIKKKLRKRELSTLATGEPERESKMNFAEAAGMSKVFISSESQKQGKIQGAIGNGGVGRKRVISKKNIRKCRNESNYFKIILW